MEKKFQANTNVKFLLAKRIPDEIASKTRRKASPGESGFPHDASTFSTKSSIA